MLGVATEPISISELIKLPFVVHRSSELVVDVKTSSSTLYLLTFLSFLPPLSVPPFRPTVTRPPLYIVCCFVLTT